MTSMYKKALITCLLLAGIFAASAQVSMTLQIPPTGVLVKNQLWNMLLVNSSNYTIMVRVNMVLLDEKNNQPVLTATSIPLSLPRGARQLQAKDLGPIQYAYGDPAYRVDGNPNGLLPTGSFQACYTITNVIKSAPLAENCIQLNVDPLSPPLLNTPSDSGKVYTPYPQFTWLPPTPLGIFNDLSYDLVLVEILPGQTSGDAVQENVPVYSGGFLRNLYLNYPSSFKALDTSKTYAWRIVALNGGKPAGMSDIWTFRVVTARPELLQKEDDSYLSLERGQNAAVASGSDILKLTYTNRTATDTTVHYMISSLQEPGNPVIQQGQLSLRYGQNFVNLPLNNGYQRRKLYQFQLVNGRGESWTVKFTWTPSTIAPSSF